MGLRTRIPFVCIRCQFSSDIRAQRHSFTDIRTSSSRHSSTAALSFPKSSTTPCYYPPPDQLTKQAYAHLTNRSVLRLRGPDVVQFLNGLLPSGLQLSTKRVSSPIFTTFLSAKGRILYDVFLYPPREGDEAWYLDVDPDSRAPLSSHLKKHKLRSKFKLETVPKEELGVYYIWPEHRGLSDPDVGIGGQDPRPLMGTRFLSSPSGSNSILSALIESGEALTIDDYKVHRIISGHAEGPKELICMSALPQESNVDFSQGIDFHKGCYLGQELTIRTHHTGVVRKRILPCQISSQHIPKDQDVAIFDTSVSVIMPPQNANINKFRLAQRGGRSTGKWLAGVGNVGLALCRLEMMTDIELTSEGTIYHPDDQFKIVWEDEESDADGKTNVNEVIIKPFVPGWLRQSIQAGIQARSDRSRRKQQAGEDEDDVQ